MELHDTVFDTYFVFPCVNRPVTKESFSLYYRSLAEDMGMHWISSKQKLIADLDPKQNIVVHHLLLRWMVSNGFKVRKIHRALQFDQKPYLKAFIDTFVSKRSQAKSKVEKNVMTHF